MKTKTNLSGYHTARANALANGQKSLKLYRSSVILSGKEKYNKRQNLKLALKKEMEILL
jgi:hypothetical protein